MHDTKVSTKAGNTVTRALHCTNPMLNQRHEPLGVSETDAPCSNFLPFLFFYWRFDIHVLFSLATLLRFFTKTQRQPLEEGTMKYRQIAFSFLFFYYFGYFCYFSSYRPEVESWDCTRSSYNKRIVEHPIKEKTKEEKKLTTVGQSHYWSSEC